MNQNFSADEAFEFDAWFLEVDEKSDTNTGSLEIVDALRSVLWRECFTAFQLDQQTALHNDVGDVLADDDSFVLHNHSPLRFGSDLSLSKLVYQRVSYTFSK